MQNLASSLVLNLCVKERSATFLLINAEAENFVKELLTVILRTKQCLKSISAPQKPVAFFPLIACYADI
jgi:hypothetical protein